MRTIVESEAVPEGDTVWNTAQIVGRALTGQRIRRGDFRVPRLAAADVTGWTVVESASRGKHLLLRLATPDDERYTLHSHLRMDGAWRVYAPGERWRGRTHTIRVALHTAAAVAVGFHLHELALVPTADEHRLVGHLGPDLLGADWDPAEATRRLRARPDRAVADALLDQRNLAGIGNEYANELCFLRGMLPTRPVSGADLPATVSLARRLLTANRDRVVRVTTGDTRRGRTTWVYGRRGEPCRRCGTPIHRSELGRVEGEERVTYFCPNCQT
jgi:endonuclease-8